MTQAGDRRSGYVAVAQQGAGVRAAIVEREHPSPRPDYYDRNVRLGYLHDETAAAT
jgi:hypothetical protein